MDDEQVPLSSHRNPVSQRLRILIADDFMEWRRQIRRILSSRPEWEIVAEAGDGREALEKAKELRPDVVLLDLGMPVMNGLEAAAGIRQHCPGARIIFVTQTNDEAFVEAALAAGAVAYVLKANVARELVALIAAVPTMASVQENRRAKDLAGSAVSSEV